LTRQQATTPGACNPNANSDYFPALFIQSPAFVANPATGKNGGDDTALVIPYLPWSPSLVGKADWARLALNAVRSGTTGASVKAGEKFWVEGFGSTTRNTNNGGTLTFDPDQANIDSVSSLTIDSKANAVTVCDGDSGSPALVLAGSAGTPITL